MNFHFVFILTLATKMVVANPRQIQGFTYLGSVQKSKISSIMTYYYISDFAANWVTAFTVCISYEGKLVSPVNPIEDASLRNLMVVTYPRAVIWTGARYSSNSWKWEAKMINLLWKNFHSSICESNKGCASAYTSGAKWAWCGTDCNNSFQFVCEWE